MPVKASPDDIHATSRTESLARVKSSPSADPGPYGRLKYLVKNRSRRLGLAALAGAIGLVSFPALAAGARPSGSLQLSAPAQTATSGSQSRSTFGVQTSTSTTPDKRAYYSFAITPGGRSYDHVAVINYSLQPLTLLVHATDAEITPQGGFALLPPNTRSTQVGTWISLPASILTINLPPRSLRIIPFSVEVPADATPGDHAGGITATLESFIRSKSGQKFKLLQSVGARLFIRVSGPLYPGLAVENLKTHYDGTANPIASGSAVIRYTVRNVGNVALGGRQSVWISGLFGSRTTAHGVPQVPLLLPGTFVEETVPVRSVFPEISMTSHVSITPLVLPGSVEPPSGPFKGSSGFWAIPWTIIGIIVFVLLAMAVLWWYRRRRRRRGARRPDSLPKGQGGAIRAEQKPQTTLTSTQATSSVEEVHK